MKVQYHFTNINKKGMVYGVGDLLKYYADISVQTKEKMEMLKKEKRVRDKLTGLLRKQTGQFGLTIDSVFNAVETSLKQGDLFYFTVDGLKICDFIKDKEEIIMDVYMNENYFLTQLALSQITNPVSFRRKYPLTLPGEKRKFMDWFESEWKKDLKFKGFNNPNFTKKVLEE